MSAHDLPVRATKCPTCPFRPGSKLACLAPGFVADRSSRICHSTGGPNAVATKGTKHPPHVCRGQRDAHLQLMAGLGVIAAPTDKAWNDARAKLMGAQPLEVRDP